MENCLGQQQIPVSKAAEAGAVGVGESIAHQCHREDFASWLWKVWLLSGCCVAFPYVQPVSSLILKFLSSKLLLYLNFGHSGLQMGSLSALMLILLSFRAKTYPNNGIRQTSSPSYYHTYKCIYFWANTHLALDPILSHHLRNLRISTIHFFLVYLNPSSHLDPSY